MKATNTLNEATAAERATQTRLSEAADAEMDARDRRARIEMPLNAAAPLYDFRMDICHLVALKMRNDEMLRSSFHGLNRTFLRNSKMVQSRLEALIMKMTRT